MLMLSSEITEHKTTLRPSKDRKTRRESMSGGNWARKPRESRAYRRSLRRRKRADGKLG